MSPINAEDEGAHPSPVTPPDSRDSLAPDPLDYETHYAEAPGSGWAAALAFFDIAITGILLCEAYYLLRHPQPSLLASPHLVWQFFLPLGLALAVYLPTDPLTKVLGICARAAGVIAVVAAAYAMLRAVPAGAAAGAGVGAPLWRNVAIGVVVAAAAGWGARTLLKPHLMRRSV